MGVNIDEILASLEQEKTAEANFADNLNSEETPTESNESPVSEEAVEETVEMTEDDMAKIAAECDAQGRVMARAFVNEINKIAADTYETDESGEATPEEAPEYSEVAEAPETVEETVEEEKVAEEFTPEERILGQLYNNYFGGNDDE